MFVHFHRFAHHNLLLIFASIRYVNIDMSDVFLFIEFIRSSMMRQCIFYLSYIQKKTNNNNKKTLYNNNKFDCGILRHRK